MRLQRGVLVAGVDPELARNIARSCHDQWSSIEQVARNVKVSPADLLPMLSQLVAAGLLESRVPVYSRNGEMEWNTTLAGGGLTMASFLKPITRAKADTLLAGVLERAAAYNDDDSKPYFITEISAFGSYVRSEAAELGDLDLAVAFSARRPGSDSADQLASYAHASGRRFSTYMDQLFWAHQQLLQTLRARSGYINLHTEDVSRFTDQSRVVFCATIGSASE